MKPCNRLICRPLLSRFHPLFANRTLFRLPMIRVFRADSPFALLSLKTNARAVKVGARPKPTTATVERAVNAAGKKKTTAATTMPTDDQVSSREESDSTDRPTSTTFGFLRCILCPRGCSGLVSFLLLGQGVPSGYLLSGLAASFRWKWKGRYI